MTPEQARNYWILEGYPLMPEWIEFCRRYNKNNVSDVSEAVSTWWRHVANWYSVPINRRAYFNLDSSGSLFFVIEGVVTYHWNLGEDHAVE